MSTGVARTNNQRGSLYSITYLKVKMNKICTCLPNDANLRSLSYTGIQDVGCNRGKVLIVAKESITMLDNHQIPIATTTWIRSVNHGASFSSAYCTPLIRSNIDKINCFM